MLEDNQTVGTQYVNGILEADGKKSLALEGGDPSVFPTCYHLHLPPFPLALLPPVHLATFIPRPLFTECQQILKQMNKQ